MNSRLSRFFACFLCFSLLIAFFPMSEIKADAYDGEIKVYSVDETLALFGTSISAGVTLKNSDGNTVGSEILEFNYFESFPATDIQIGESYTNPSFDGLNNTFQNYHFISGARYLVYYAQLPELVQNQFPLGGRFQVNMPLNVAFDNVHYLQWGCGFAFSNQNYVQLRSDNRPNNYMQVNGIAQPSVYYRYNSYYDYYLYAQTYLKVIPDRLNDVEPVLPDVNLFCTQNVISYNSTTAKSFDVGVVVSDGVQMFNTRKLFFVCLCPVVNSDAVSDSTVRPIQNRDLKPIIQTTEDIKDLLEIIVSGSGASGLDKDDFVSLWVPSTAQLLTHEQSLRVMLHDTFGSAYEAEELLQDAVDAISEESVEPLTHLDLPALSVPVDGQDITIMQAQEVPLKPDGFDTLFTVLASIIDILCTFAVINMLRKRFEKGVLENDG